jgi:hypothetical protein
MHVLRLQLDHQINVESNPAMAMRGNRQPTDDQIAHASIV